jgi:hypothetical protein
VFTVSGSVHAGRGEDVEGPRWRPRLSGTAATKGRRSGGGHLGSYVLEQSTGSALRRPHSSIGVRGAYMRAGEVTATFEALPGQARELWERAGQAPATRRHDHLDYPEVGTRQQPELAQLVGRDAPIAGDDQFTWVVVTKCAHVSSIRPRPT